MRLKLGQEIQVRARNAAVCNVADDGDFQIIEATFFLANRECIQECLRGMLMAAKLYASL